MKFLVDAQLPKSLSVLLNELGNDSIHTLQLPEKNFSTDSAVLRIAQEQSRVIITKDSDFLDSFIISGKPEKLILIRTGNIRNSELLVIFQKNILNISTLLEKGNLLEITREEIILHV